MYAVAPTVDLSSAPLDVLVLLLQKMSVKDRFTCALVCKAWAGAATAATHSITFRQHSVQGLSCLQQWLEKNGAQLEVLQLHLRSGAALAALPCVQLQDLQIYGANWTNNKPSFRISVHVSVE